MTFTRKREKDRKVSPKHQFYCQLRDYRIKWEAAGGTRGTLRRARKLHGTLFPPLPEQSDG